jgi:cytochrome c553
VEGDTSGVNPALADLDESDTTLAASTPLQGLLYPEEVPAPVSDRCGRCHGADGAGRGLGAFPRLAGQRPAYLFAALRAYAEGERHSGIMQPVAAGLGEEEMREIALFYSRLTPPRATAPSAGLSGTASAGGSRDASGAAPADPSTGGAVDTLAIRRGERIAQEGVPRERVPACAGCHGPSTHPNNPFYPILAGQYADYIALQLDLFKDDRRGGSAYSRLMHPTADELTEEQVRDVALYYGSLNDGSLDDGSLDDGSLGSDLEQTGAAATDTTR